VWEPTFPGCIIEAVPIRLFKMWDEKGTKGDRTLLLNL